jgi:hypothetical protein
MHEQILKYLTLFNKIAKISIEYAIAEPTLSVSGEIRYDLHLVYTPKVETLLNSYVTGISLDVINEIKIETTAAHTALITKYVNPDNVPENYYDEFNAKLLSNVNSIIISNIARFCNFKFKTSTDPFLSMFLEEKHIIWKTKDFDTFFFSNKELFKPSKTFIADSVISSLSEVLAKYKEFSDGCGNTRNRVVELYEQLHNIVRLHFIALRYLKTNELSSTMEDTYELILSTLAQAARPWDYLEECKKRLGAERNLQQEQNPDNSRELLKAQALNFLQYKIVEEAKSLYNP